MTRVARRFFCNQSPFWGLVFVLQFFVVGCAEVDVQKGRVPSAEWSRGVPVVDSITGQHTMAFFEDEVVFVWPEGNNDAAKLFFQRGAGEPVELLEREGRIREPRLSVVDDALVLMWLWREPGSAGWELNSAELSPLPRSITSITDPTINVGGLVVTETSTGLIAVWEDRFTNSIMGALVDNDGVSSPFTLANSGTFPAAIVDESDTLHLIWLGENQISYEGYDLKTAVSASDGTFLAEIDLGTANQLTYPALGLTGDTLTAVWSVFKQSGLEAGTGYTEYISFETNNRLMLGFAEKIRIHPFEEQVEIPFESDYFLTTYSPAPSRSSTYVFGPDVAHSKGDSLAVSLSIHQQLNYQTVVQPAVAHFQNGEYIGFQMAGKTTELSNDTRLLTDPDGNLHLSWREGADGSRIYLATTEPAAKAAINRISANDISAFFLNATLEMVVGLFFFPFALLWIAPGMILLGIRHLRNNNETASSRPAQALILIAIALYTITKLALLPMFTYSPYSAWIDLPPFLETVGQSVYPLFILVTSFLLTQTLIRKREVVTPLFFFFVWAAIDAVHSLAIYGVLLFGAG